jgi:hypothetical protein
MKLTQAIDHIRANLARTWVVDPELFQHTGLVARSEPMTMLDATNRASKQVIAEGSLLLTQVGLKVAGTDWELPLEEVAATAIDMRRRLQFRTPRRVFEAVLPNESPTKWLLLTDHWRQLARGT